MPTEGDTKKEENISARPGYFARIWCVLWAIARFFLGKAWGVVWYFIDKLIVVLVALLMFAALVVLVLYAFFPDATSAVLWQGPALVAALAARITWADVEMLVGMIAAIAGRILKRSE